MRLRKLRRTSIAKKILITGASGLVGTVLRNGLAGDYELSGIDIRPVSGMPSVVADMTDLAAIEPGFQGIDVVIDLAAVAPMETTWDVVHRNNLSSTYNALEAARRAGVGRVIFASSNHATGMYEKDHPYSAIVAGRYEGLDPTTIPYITTRMPIRPDGPYGIGKAFGEASGRYYSDEHGLSVICIRIGTLNKQARPTNERQRATLLSHRDLVQLVSRCIDAPDDLRFSIFYGVSANKWRFWDIADSRSAIGYEPQDDASGMAIQG